MNEGFNQPQNPSNRRPRRRKRNFSNHPSQGGQQGQGQGQGHGRSGGGQNRNNRNRTNRNNRGQRRSNVFVGPMDHSYRSQNGQGQGRFRNGFSDRQAGELEPLAAREDAPAKIYALIDDLFFVAKIQEVGRQLNVKVEFVKSEKDVASKTEENEEKPSLIIVDLNSSSIKPLTIIPKLRSKFKKATSIVGFVSHVQGDLKMKAQEAGCDVVMPRSTFSQNLASLLRRHGAADEPEENFNKV
jgi:CheY-like chemotaxis protein